MMAPFPYILKIVINYKWLIFSKSFCIFCISCISYFRKVQNCTEAIQFFFAYPQTKKFKRAAMCITGPCVNYLTQKCEQWNQKNFAGLHYS